MQGLKHLTVVVSQISEIAECSWRRKLGHGADCLQEVVTQKRWRCGDVCVKSVMGFLVCSKRQVVLLHQCH